MLLYDPIMRGHKNGVFKKSTPPSLTNGTGVLFPPCWCGNIAAAFCLPFMPSETVCFHSFCNPPHCHYSGKSTLGHTTFFPPLAEAKPFFHSFCNPPHCHYSERSTLGHNNLFPTTTSSSFPLSSSSFPLSSFLFPPSGYSPWTSPNII